MKLFRRLREFAQSVPSRIVGSHMPDNSDGISRLHILAPTVRPEEVAKLEAKPRTNPVDFEDLPV